jgi:hypothetical protein
MLVLSVQRKNKKGGMVATIPMRADVKLVFYSAKDNVVDYQRLTMTTNVLGTTFPPSWVFGSFLLP